MSPKMCAIAHIFRDATRAGGHPGAPRSLRRPVVRVGTVLCCVAGLLSGKQQARLSFAAISIGGSRLRWTPQHRCENCRNRPA